MPVSFFVAPALASDPDAAHLSSLTLSYTFYPVDKPQDAVAAKQGGEPGKGS
jgi:cytochrome c oxidase assembly protein subunit 11